MREADVLEKKESEDAVQEENEENEDGGHPGILALVGAVAGKDYQSDSEESDVDDKGFDDMYESDEFDNEIEE